MPAETGLNTPPWICNFCERSLTTKGIVLFLMTLGCRSCASQHVKQQGTDKAGAYLPTEASYSYLCLRFSLCEHAWAGMCVRLWTCACLNKKWGILAFKVSLLTSEKWHLGFWAFEGKWSSSSLNEQQVRNGKRGHSLTVSNVVMGLLWTQWCHSGVTVVTGWVTRVRCLNGRYKCTDGLCWPESCSSAHFLMKIDWGVLIGPHVLYTFPQWKRISRILLSSNRTKPPQNCCFLYNIRLTKRKLRRRNYLCWYRSGA